MIETITLSPGVTLRCHKDHRFKQGCLSLQLLRPMAESEAAKNALLPAVWLRGTTRYPDLRAITLRLDDLYGASAGTLVRRIGDYQTTGLYCGFMEDRFAMDGDRILAPMVEFLGELIHDPVMQDGGFCRDYVEGEKKNLISTMESERNDKRAYANAQLLKHMCRGDSFALSRLGTTEQAAAIDSRLLYTHHRTLLETAAVELFYVGSQDAQTVADHLRNLLPATRRTALPPQTALAFSEGTDTVEEMEVAQSQLCMGFTTPITNRREDFAAMQVLNTLFGAGMTSKLFMHVRERLSLCYSIGSSYYGTKGIVTVCAGIHAQQEELARQEILAQLSACQKGDITKEELEAAKEALLSGLRGVHDSPAAIESYYSTGALSGLNMTPAEYSRAVAGVELDHVVAAASTLTLHTKYFLKGVGA